MNLFKQFYLWTLFLAFLLNNQTLNAQISKPILIKSVESYVLLNYYHLYEMFIKEKITPMDSFFVEVDSGSFCVNGFEKKSGNTKIIVCLYEGKNNEVYDIIYGDLNNDGEMDAIVSFSLESFGGGNSFGRFHATLIGNKGSVFVSR